MTKSREREYTAPRLYEIAFDMNRKGEVDFLVHCFKRFGRRPIRRVLDIACGTGPHLVRLAERGYQMAGLDLSRMVFPQELRALVELAGGFQFVQWFFGFKPHQVLERSRHPLLMVVVLRKI